MGWSSLQNAAGLYHCWTGTHNSNNNNKDMNYNNINILLLLLKIIIINKNNAFIKMEFWVYSKLIIIL